MRVGIWIWIWRAGCRERGSGGEREGVVAQIETCKWHDRLVFVQGVLMGF